MKRCYACFREYGDSYDICPYCGRIEITRPSEPVYLVPGTVLAGRYIIGESTGAGGFGIVYKAWDSKLETVVAIKEFFMSRLVVRAEKSKDIIVIPKSQLEFEYRKERFLAEARIMARFNNHRSITNVYEFFEENNTAYIVMEFLSGEPLNKYILRNGGKLNVDLAIKITNEVGNALKSLHGQGIIHRDVAPDNIFVCSGEDARVKLMDFGSAKLADSTDNVVDAIMKLGFSPAEQYYTEDTAKKADVGPWSDIYALGATLYVMLTGVKPIESTDRKNNDTLDSPDKLNPEVSANLSNSVMKAMAVDRHMRFSTVDEFLSAINGERKVQTLEKERFKKRFRRTSGIVASLLVVAIIAAVVIWTYGSKAADETLARATISVWFSVADGSSEDDAMKTIIDDFSEKFPEVTVNYKAIPEADYESSIRDAAANGELPDLFESTGLPEDLLEDALDLNDILGSEQASQCLFIDQYDKYYGGEKKRLPLGIEIPVAYVITSGKTEINYSENYFTELSDFGVDAAIAVDDRHMDVLSRNFNTSGAADKETFLVGENNTSAVLLSTTMIVNEVRTTLTNYEKNYVFLKASEIKCAFTYEWSLGGGSKAEVKAAGKFLSWMLGSSYQNSLMISECSDGQIPVNEECFKLKISSRHLEPIEKIYDKFIFER